MNIKEYITMENSFQVAIKNFQTAIDFPSPFSLTDHFNGNDIFVKVANQISFLRS